MYDSVDDVPWSPILPANVASEPTRGPLIYPGGKTWLLPIFRHWCRTVRLGLNSRLVDPFAGGAIVSMSAVYELLFRMAYMVEKNESVAAVWEAALHWHGELHDAIGRFQMTPDEAQRVIASNPDDVVGKALKAIVLSRVSWSGGQLAKQSWRRKNGERVIDRGRRHWNVKRLQVIIHGMHMYLSRDRFAFRQGCGMELLEGLANDGRSALFVDPPYTAGGKNPGATLYLHHELDHSRLFELVDATGLPFLMTHQAIPEVLELVNRHGFGAARIRRIQNFGGSTIGAEEFIITRQEFLT